MLIIFCLFVTLPKIKQNCKHCSYVFDVENGHYFN